MTDTPKTRDEFDARLVECLAALDAFQAKRWKERGYTWADAPKITTQPGAKYIRLVIGDEQRGHQPSCYAFLDYQGNIYKSESWKKPAKHVRGNIFNENFDIGPAFTEYGVVYLR